MASGKFVSDETVVKLAADSYKNILDVSSKTPRILFDGFPRTMRQAQALDSKDIAIKIHLALYIDVPDVTIINRISSRWVHAESGRTYASDYNPPKKVCYCRVVLRSKFDFSPVHPVYLSTAWV